MTLHSVGAFKRYIGSLPATEIVEQWGSVVAKVGGKVFALMGEDSTSIAFKVSEISFDGLTTLEGIGQAPYFAKRAWVIKVSHGMIASKLTRKLRAELGLD